MSRVTQAADALLQQFRGKEKYLLEDDLLPESVAEAYDIQVAYQGSLAAEYGAVAGYKIAYTTTALQQASGISEPVAGGDTGEQRAAFPRRAGFHRFPATRHRV